MHDSGYEWLSTLIEINAYRHTMEYNKNIDRPLITVGWSDLRSEYKLNVDHSIMFWYVGVEEAVQSIISQKIMDADAL